MTDYGKKLYELLTKASGVPPAGSLAAYIRSSNITLQRGGDVYNAIIGDAAGANLAADIAAIVAHVEAGGDIHDVLYADASGASLAVDIATIVSEVGLIQTDIGDPSTRSNSQDLETMLGNPDTANCTIYGAMGGEYVNGGGVPEVDNVRAHIFKTGGLGGGVATKSLTYDGSVSYPIFTVTGTVIATVIGVITGALSNHADATSVGTATSAAGFMPATAGTAMQTANQIWKDNTPSKFETSMPSPHIVGDGEDITVVGTANLATGTVVFTCWWTEINGGTVVAV